MKNNNMLSRTMWLCPALKKGKGNIESQVIKEEGVSGFRRPTFPVNKDKGGGLTFALNDAWKFQVTSLGYKYDTLFTW